jgi:ArsR family transcriptional regulator
LKLLNQLINKLEASSQIARICKTLSVDTRVKIVQMLNGQALCVRAIAARLRISESAVSQHLRILRDADLVVPDKRGYWVHYQINPETLEKWGEVIEDLFTQQKTT